MSILVVDDSLVSLNFFADMLRCAGYHDLLLARSVTEAFAEMQAEPGSDCCPLVDLILMDIHMPDRDGLQACRELKSDPRFQDIPIIIISGAEHLASLQAAFHAGAIDFLRKPPEQIELLARVRSALRLKAEIDNRKARELELTALAAQLATANAELHRLSSLDGLTGIANRYALDSFLVHEWRRAQRHGHSIAVILADIDYFKRYNDTYGHLEGDNCLKRAAAAFSAVIKRSEDLVARYGGEEFIAILPETDLTGALRVADEMRLAIARLDIGHESSPTASHVTTSIGVAATVPAVGQTSATLVAQADRALYAAKQAGRNRVESATVTTL